MAELTFVYAFTSYWTDLGLKIVLVAGIEPTTSRKRIRLLIILPQNIYSNAFNDTKELDLIKLAPTHSYVVPRWLS